MGFKILSKTHSHIVQYTFELGNIYKKIFGSENILQYTWLENTLPNTLRSENILQNTLALKNVERNILTQCTK